MIPKSSEMEPEREVVESSPAQAEGEASRQEGSVPRRPRRQTKFYEPDQPTPKKALQIKEGEGIQLKAIPSVSSQLARWRADEPLLLELHRILYKRTGTRTRRKRDIGEFSGFVFTQTEHQHESKSLKERVASVKELRRLVDLFNLSQKTGKAKMVSAIVEFLMKPEDKTLKPAIKTTSKNKTTVVATKKRTKESVPKKKQTKRQKLASAKTTRKQKQLEEEEEAEEDKSEDPSQETPKDKDKS